MKQEDESLIESFFVRQMESRKAKDWSTRIMKDLVEFGVKESLHEISLIKEENWKLLIKTRAIECSLKFLNSITGSKSRKYQDLKMSNYLSSQIENVPIETAKFIAKTQTHMIETVKTNFKEYYKPNLTCNLCLLNECNQSHLLYCTKLIGSNQIITYIPDYEDI